VIVELLLLLLLLLLFVKFFPSEGFTKIVLSLVKFVTISCKVLFVPKAAAPSRSHILQCLGKAMGDSDSEGGKHV